MEIITKLLGTIIPKEWLEDFKLEEVIETEVYVELVLRETTGLPKGI